MIDLKFNMDEAIFSNITVHYGHGLICSKPVLATTNFDPQLEEAQAIYYYDTVENCIIGEYLDEPEELNGIIFETSELDLCKIELILSQLDEDSLKDSYFMCFYSGDDHVCSRYSLHLYTSSGDNILIYEKGQN